MGKLLLLVVIVFTMASCSTYQYNTISSASVKKDLSTGEFISENDSLKITYNFYGEGAPVNISVFNKLNSGIHIDWSRSALIVGDKAISYTGKNISISGNVAANTYRYNKSINTVEGGFKATAVVPEDRTFIPPHSEIEKSVASVKQLFVTAPDSVFRVSTLLPLEKTGDISNADIKIKLADFTKESSPLIFKSYLTFVLEKQPSTQLFTSVDEFYVSNIVKTSVKPKFYNNYIRESGNIFYSSKVTGYGKAMSGITVAAAAIALTGLTADSSEPSSQ